MNVHLLSPVHIQKLGHSIEEIRVRALSSVFSKYSLQLVDETNLENTKQLLDKLLDWFSFSTHPEEEKVLRLILKILQYENSDLILKEGGLDTTFRRITIIEKKLNPKNYHYIEEIKGIITKAKQNAVEYAASEKTCSSEPPISTSTSDLPKHKTVVFSALVSPGYSTNTLFTNDSPKVAKPEIKESNSTNSLLDKVDNKKPGPPFKIEYFPWQPLVSSDRKVLASIYDGLRYIDNKTSILQSCQFFNDVILKDFPAEIFIQRPLIVQTFLELVECDEEGIRIPVLLCLTELIQSLKMRFWFTLDVSVVSLKQDTYANVTYPSVSSDDTRSERSEQFHLNLGCSEDDPHPEEDEEDEIILRRQSYTLLGFCFTVVSQTAPHLSKSASLQEHNLQLRLIQETLSFIAINIKPTIWYNEPNMKEKLYQILGSFQDCLKYHRTKNKIIYIIVLTIIVKLLNSLKPPTGFELGEILPRGLQVELSVCVSDFVLVMLFPKLHEQIMTFVKQLIGQKEKEIIQDYKDARLVCRSMESTNRFLSGKFKKKWDMLKCAENALLSLEFHKNFSFIREFVKVCLLHWSKTHLKDKECEFRGKIFIKLLSHGDCAVKTQTYKTIHDIVLNYLGVEEAAKPKFEHPGDRIKFLFQSDIFTEIICHGLNSEIVEVRECSNEVMIHLLKAKWLMSEEHWSEFLLSLTPSLPLLQCFADKSTALGRCITKMLDPDVADSIHLPRLDVLRGNLRLLFSKDGLTREEAISRLCWMMAKEDPGGTKLPRLSVLQGVNLTSVCSSIKPQEAFRVRQSFYSVGSLCDVIEMLCAIGVEPSVRRSALSQISVMLEDDKLHSTFLEQNGLTTVRSILQNSLVEKEFHNYPDSVLPIMNILKHLALYNPTIRQQLSIDADVYMCVLRGLLLFSNDDKLRQDATELLYLLLYSEHIIAVPPDRAIKYKISLPEVVVARTHFPMLTHIHWRNSRHLEPSLRGTLMSKPNCASLLRICWTAEWLGGMSVILALEKSDLQDDIFSPRVPDDMKLTSDDLFWLKSCSLGLSCKQGLYDIQNATTHETVIECIQKLYSCLMLYEQLNKAAETSSQTGCDIPLFHLSWETTLERFLSSLPSCQQDEILLALLIRFLEFLVKTLPSKDLTEWVTNILTDQLHTLPNILKTCGNEETGITGREIRRVIIELAQLIVTKTPDSDLERWTLFITIVSDHLRLNTKQEFYNVAYIDWLLSLLADITGCWNWSYIGKTQLYGNVISRVMEIIVAFHCSKDSTRSFMGMNIVKNSFLILNHMLSDVQDNMKGWEQLWLHALSQVKGHTEDLNYCWLLSLWFIRDPLIRAASLHLIGGFATTPRGCELLIDRIGIEFELVWTYGFQILLDGDECGLVREKCAFLLSNLTSHGSSVTSADFLRHLRDISFYTEMTVLVNKLDFGITLDGVVSNTAEGYCLVTTPALLTSVTSLIFNITCLNPIAVSTDIVESGLYDALMSCFGGIPEVSNYASTISECIDVVNMYVGVCRLLTKCASVSNSALSLLVQSQHCINSLYGMLNFEIFANHSKEMRAARNQLWCEILDLLSLLLASCQGVEKRSGEVDGSFVAINQAMTGTGVDPFISSLYLSMLSGCTELRHRCLNLTINLFGHELTTQAQWSVADILDRNVSSQAVDLSGLDMWKGLVVSEHLTRHFGIRTCDILLQMYTGASRRSAVRNSISDALASLLALCKPAQDFAIENGLIESIALTLRQNFVKLSLETVDSLRKPSDKKRIEPLLSDMETLLQLTCNLMLRNEKAKLCVAECGLSDLIHKLWSWCSARTSLLITTLKMLNTYTHSSNRACQSLLLLGSLTGVGLRKSPGSVTLIHCIMNQVNREMELVSNTHSLHTLHLCLQLLCNACHAAESRSVIAKGHFLHGLVKLHPSLAAKRKCFGEELVHVWFQFLIVFTSFQEGQLALSKNPEILEVVIAMSSSSKAATRFKAMSTLRNVCTHQLNRLRLLSNSSFLNLILLTLSSKQMEEVILAAQMVWSLSYNSQKAKLILRNAGFAIKLLDARKHCVLVDHTEALNVIDSALSVLENK